MFDFFKEILNSFRQNSLERIKSPLLGAFVFSWLGFNWQLVAVLILGKDDILLKLHYINENFGLESLLIGPSFTTFLICITLPTANKIITRIQRKTNFDTNMLILQSKIDIAEKQLEIADSEAKKKLSEEREKKNIESNIKEIITSRDLYATQLDVETIKGEKQQKNIALLYENEKKLSNNIYALETKIKNFEVENSNLKNLTLDYKENIEKKSTELSKLTNDLNNITNEAIKNSIALKESSDIKFKLLGEVNLLNEQSRTLNDQIKKLSEENKKLLDTIIQLSTPKTSEQDGQNLSKILNKNDDYSLQVTQDSSKEFWRTSMAEAMSVSPTAKIIEELMQKQGNNIAAEFATSSSMKLAQQIIQNPVAKLMTSYSASPAMQAIEQTIEQLKLKPSTLVQSSPQEKIMPYKQSKK